MQPYLGPTRLRKTRTVPPVDLLTFERRDPSDLTLFRALYGPRERVLLGAILSIQAEGNLKRHDGTRRVVNSVVTLRVRGRQSPQSPRRSAANIDDVKEP
jgi:hypothetical protein